MHRLGYFILFVIVLPLWSLLNSTGHSAGEYTPERFIVAGESITELDFNSDGDVNLNDYTILAAAWLCFEGEPGYNEICDLDDSGQVEITDLRRFTGAWLGRITYTGVQTDRDKLNFNAGWKYYKHGRQGNEKQYGLQPYAPVDRIRGDAGSDNRAYHKPYGPTADGLHTAGTFR